MRKKLAKLLIVALLLTCLPVGTANAAVDDKPLRVGLYYNTTTVVVSNLANVQGTGYAFGYYDADRNFIKLGRPRRARSA